MKKIVLVVVVLGVIGIFAACKSIDYAKPSFEKSHSFVIDSYAADGSLEDNIRLYNQTKKTGISFTVYVHDPKTMQWKVYGTGNLKGPGDTDFIDSRLYGELDDYRYYAIEALDGKDYSYDFDKKRNDLHIFIFNK
jgi:hypothetical protein